MDILTRTFHDIEEKTIKKTEQISKIILDELERIYRIPFVSSKDVICSNLLFLLLLSPEFSMIRDVVIELLEKYHFNKRLLFLQIVSLLCQNDVTEDVRKVRRECIQNLPYCLGIENQNNYYKIKTEFGILEFYMLSSIVQNPNLKYQLQKNYLGSCHQAVELFQNYFREDFITTSKFEYWFGGEFYHSYYTLQNKEGIVDISKNIFYPGDSFNEIFNPNKVLEYPTKELKRRFLEFQKEVPEIVNDYDKVLQLALWEERKRL